MRKRGFTLIELIISIVILGIVASMTIHMIFSIYKNYMQNESIARLSAQTELVLNQISKLLQHRIKGSAVVRKHNENNPAQDKVVALISAGADAAGDPKYNILEFVPYSFDLFDNEIYSGVVDLSDISANIIKTPDSKLRKAKDMLEKLDPKDPKDPKGKASDDIAIFFKEEYPSYNVFTNGSDKYIPITVNLTNTANDVLVPTINIPNGTKISEQYHLAHTAMAIMPKDIGGQNIDNKDFDLLLYYNYKPWKGEHFKDDGKKALLAKHVSMFKFKNADIGNTILVKLCLRDNKNQKGSISKNGIDFTVCKTRAIR